MYTYNNIKFNDNNYFEIALSLSMELQLYLHSICDYTTTGQLWNMSLNASALWHVYFACVLATLGSKKERVSIQEWAL
jgi:hypothetical protein